MKLRNKTTKDGIMGRSTLIVRKLGENAPLADRQLTALITAIQKIPQVMIDKSRPITYSESDKLISAGRAAMIEILAKSNSFDTSPFPSRLLAEKPGLLRLELDRSDAFETHVFSNITGLLDRRSLYRTEAAVFLTSVAFDAMVYSREVRQTAFEILVLTSPYYEETHEMMQWLGHEKLWRHSEKEPSALSLVIGGAVGALAGLIVSAMVATYQGFPVSAGGLIGMILGSLPPYIKNYINRLRWENRSQDLVKNAPDKLDALWRRLEMEQRKREAPPTIRHI